MFVPDESPTFDLGDSSGTSIFMLKHDSQRHLAPPHISATSVGFALFCFNVFGVGLGPLVTGWIGDLHSLTMGLLVSVIIGTFSVIPFYLAARRFGKDQQRLEAIRDL